MLRSILGYKNSDSTLDLNSRNRVIRRGIFPFPGNGIGRVKPSNSTLDVTIDPFIAESVDGLVITNDSVLTTTLASIASNIGVYWLCVYTKYVVGGTPLLQVGVFPDSTITTVVDKEFYIKFAKVTITVPVANAAAATWDFEAGEHTDAIGGSRWRNPVSTFSKLPVPDEYLADEVPQPPNHDGDVRITNDSNVPYLWDGPANTWVPMPTAVLQCPVLVNGGFENAITGPVTYKHSAYAWEFSGSDFTKASWRLDNTNARSGFNHLQVDLNAGTFTSGSATLQAIQYLHVPVNVGQVILVDLWVRNNYTISNIAIPAHEGISLLVNWDDSSGGTTVVSADIPLLPVSGATDGSYRHITSSITVPSNVLAIRSISLVVNLAYNDYSLLTNGVFYIDDIQVKVVSDINLPYPFYERKAAVQSVKSLIIEDPTSNFSDIATLFEFDKSTPANEGTLSIKRKDGQYAASPILPPMLNILGRIALGGGLDKDLAQSLLGRVSTVSPSNFSAYTLIWENKVSTSGTIDTTKPFTRMYSYTGALLGGFVFTINACWDGTDWNADNTGATAIKLTLIGTDLILDKKSITTVPWNDISWDGASSISLSTLRTDLNTVTDTVGKFFNSRTISASKFLDSTTNSLSNDIYDEYIYVKDLTGNINLKLPDPSFGAVSTSGVFPPGRRLIIIDAGQTANANGTLGNVSGTYTLTLQRTTGSVKIQGLAADKVLSSSFGRWEVTTDGTDFFIG